MLSDAAEPEVIAAGMRRLRIIAGTCFLCGLMDVFCGILRGMGAAILPVSSRTLLTDGNLHYKKLVSPEMSTHTVIAWLKNRTLSSSSEHFIKLFREMFLGERAQHGDEETV